MAKPEAKEVEETSQPLNYKTWVLRVSIHCEGCKRKVKKILQNINGVHEVEIDRKQQKVTVTTITDAQTLIKKLVKAGKHAEPWPEKKPSSKNIKEIPVPNEIPAGETSAAVHDGGSQKLRAETEAPEKELHDPPKNEEKGEISGNAQVREMINGDDGGGETAENIAGAERVVESPPEGGGEKFTAGESRPGRLSGTVAVEAVAGGEGRRKKKKGQKKEKGGGGGGGATAAGDEVGPQIVPAPTSTGSAAPLDQIPPLNHCPPCNQPYHYPLHMAVSQPAYVASYNTAHPSSSYGPYYATPPPYSYAYVHSTIPRDISSSLPPLPQVEQSNSPPSSPFDFFSDENPSGCSVM